jgi:uncharacterized protein (DUF1786 family)
LAIDIGAGTEDVLLYDDSKTIENCVKMVLPSPTLIYADRIEELTSKQQTILIKGDAIGGSAVTAAIRKHLKHGLKLVMTEKAALTVRNSIEQVRSMGIQVVENESEFSKPDGTKIELEEINITKITEFLKKLGTRADDVDVVAVAVQDHGVPTGDESNRKFRMRKMEELLRKNPKVETLAFEENEIPECFKRMRSAADACKRQLPRATTIVMDTAPSAVLGCLEDPTVIQHHRILAVNIGNGHTMAAIVEDEKILGLMEHHTEAFYGKPSKLGELLLDFANGKTKGENIFVDGGHGAFYLGKDEKEKFSAEKIGTFAVTGPNRSIADNIGVPIHFASPAGDVMMTGTMGLIKATLRKLG